MLSKLSCSSNGSGTARYSLRGEGLGEKNMALNFLLQFEGCVGGGGANFVSYDNIARSGVILDKFAPDTTQTYRCFHF